MNRNRSRVADSTRFGTFRTLFRTAKSIAFAAALLLSLALIPSALHVAHASSHDGLCSCGREYATASEGDFLEFDCLGCGRNFTSCTCTTCWCGSKLHRETESDGTERVTCVECGLPCEECVCRDRSYYAALIGVKNGVTGNEIPNPSNGFFPIFAAIIPFAVFLALYFTVYRRRGTAARNKNNPRALQAELDRIDREPSARERYKIAKERCEQLGDLRRRSDRFATELSRKKNELLVGALNEPYLKTAAEENLRTCAARNAVGYAGSVERIDRLWNAEKKTFAESGKAVSERSVAETVAEYDTNRDEIALFELAVPLNAGEDNLLRPASNLTRFAARLSIPYTGDGAGVDPETEPQRRETFEKLLPGADVDKILNLCNRPSERMKNAENLPELTSRKIGDRTRFPEV